MKKKQQDEGSGSGGYSCPECGKVFEYKVTLAVHRTITHEPLPVSRDDSGRQLKDVGKENPNSKKRKSSELESDVGKGKGKAEEEEPPNRDSAEKKLSSPIDLEDEGVQAALEFLDPDRMQKRVLEKKMSLREERAPVYTCKKCGKKFSCQQGLGGHSRIHNKSI